MTKPSQTFDRCFTLTRTKTEQNRTEVNALRRRRTHACGVVCVRRAIEKLPPALRCGKRARDGSKSLLVNQNKTRKSCATPRLSRQPSMTKHAPPSLANHVQRQHPPIKGLLQTSAPALRTHHFSSPPVPGNRTTTYVVLQWAVDTPT